MGPKEPTPQTEHGNNPDSNNRIIQRLRRNRIRRRETENNGDEPDPRHGDESYGLGELAEIKRPFAGPKGGGVDEPNKNGDAVGYVEPDCCDGGCRCEGDGGAEGGEREAEAEKGGEPDGADGGTEAVVYFVEEVRLFRGVSVPVLWI